jgi:hypothetical protein
MLAACVSPIIHDFALANVAAHEEQDAKTFAEWGADSLKCMSVP